MFSNTHIISQQEKRQIGIQIEHQMRKLQIKHQKGQIITQELSFAKAIIYETICIKQDILFYWNTYFSIYMPQNYIHDPSRPMFETECKILQDFLKKSIDNQEIFHIVKTQSQNKSEKLTRQINANKWKQFVLKLEGNHLKSISSVVNEQQQITSQRVFLYKKILLEEPIPQCRMLLLNQILRPILALRILQNVRLYQQILPKSAEPLGIQDCKFWHLGRIQFYEDDFALWCKEMGNFSIMMLQLMEQKFHVDFKLLLNKQRYFMEKMGLFTEDWMNRL